MLLEARLQAGYDLAVIVNPNSPTGSYVPRRELESVLAKAPLQTRVWVDETYLEYAGEGESLEIFAARSQKVVVCKSMSKAYSPERGRRTSALRPPLRNRCGKSRPPGRSVSRPRSRR